MEKFRQVVDCSCTGFTLFFLSYFVSFLLIEIAFAYMSTVTVVVLSILTIRVDLDLQHFK